MANGYEQTAEQRELYVAQTWLDFFRTKKAYQNDANKSLLIAHLDQQGITFDLDHLNQAFAQIVHTKLRPMDSFTQAKHESLASQADEDAVVAAEAARLEAEEKQRNAFPYTRRQLLARDSSGQRKIYDAAVKKFGLPAVLAVINGQEA